MDYVIEKHASRLICLCIHSDGLCISVRISHAIFHICCSSIVTKKKYEKKYEASLVLESKKIHHSSRCIAIMMDGKKKVYAIPIHRMAHLKWRNERSSWRTRAHIRWSFNTMATMYSFFYCFFHIHSSREVSVFVFGWHGEGNSLSRIFRNRQKFEIWTCQRIWCLLVKMNVTEKKNK